MEIGVRKKCERGCMLGYVSMIDCSCRCCLGFCVGMVVNTALVADVTACVTAEAAAVTGLGFIFGAPTYRSIPACLATSTDAKRPWKTA